MSKLNVNIRLDKELKQEVSDLANEMGTNLSTIVSMFLVKFTRERRLELDFNNAEIEEVSDIEFDKIKNLENYDRFMESISGK